MRFMKALVIGMGVLIVVATTVLIVLIVHRLAGPPVAVPATAGSVLLDEPMGTRIVTIAPAGDRLAVQLQGGGPDRLLLVDPRSGAVMGRIVLRAQ
jgi:uncharacterized protein DUF6476